MLIKVHYKYYYIIFLIYANGVTLSNIKKNLMSFFLLKIDTLRAEVEIFQAYYFRNIQVISYIYQLTRTGVTHDSSSLVVQ